ncbi:MAG TPA: ABC transporter permease [Bryobacteraceae bacterium]|nr:ABC transporter permease [Bryobacteraceae bacterium]
MREFLQNSGFTLAAVLTLALGIGANTSIFTVTNVLLLRPLPYRSPRQLVSLTAKDETKDFSGTLLRYELVRDHNQSFDRVAAWANDDFNLTGHGDPAQVQVTRVSANFFSLLGIQPQLGRTFSRRSAPSGSRPCAFPSAKDASSPRPMMRRRPESSL